MRKSDELDSERNKRHTGVTYQIVSHLPKSSEQLETRESLANLAVSHGESYIGMCKRNDNVTYKYLICVLC